MPPKARLVYSPKYVVDIGGHVFPTRKFGLVAEEMGKHGELIEPRPPSREDLLLAHDGAWVDKVLSGKMSLDEEVLMELPFSPAVSLAHQLSAAGTTLACRHALERGVGLHIGGGSHHAFRDHGEGFCVINDIACALLRMKADGKIKKAAVIDLDVHQGNGTAAIFAGDKDIFTFSMHQQDIYPEKKEASSLDIGLRAGTGDSEYLKPLKNGLDKVLEFEPELVIYQAGVDCYEKDALGGLKLTREGLARRDRLVFEACLNRRIPVAVTLGGGYAADIKETVALHIQTLSIFGSRRESAG